MGKDYRKEPRETFDAIMICAAVINASVAIIRLVLDLKNNKQNRNRPSQR